MNNGKPLNYQDFLRSSDLKRPRTKIQRMFDFFQSGIDTLRVSSKEQLLMGRTVIRSVADECGVDLENIENNVFGDDDQDEGQ